ncbi:MAG: CRISPR-associated endonuclease Cas2 [Planctomycetota bacterium]
MNQWYLLTYDVRDDKRLRKVAKTLEGYGTRLQYSVFHCHLSRTDLESCAGNSAQSWSPKTTFSSSACAAIA